MDCLKLSVYFEFETGRTIDVTYVHLINYIVLKFQLILAKRNWDYELKILCNEVILQNMERSRALNTDIVIEFVLSPVSRRRGKY